jgi:hypothetical protein
MGEKYGVHHSVINDLREEAQEVMKLHWEAKSKRIGRPKNEGPTPLEVQEKSFARERQGFDIQRQWLELQLKHALNERDCAHGLIKSTDQSKLKKKA